MAKESKHFLMGTSIKENIRMGGLMALGPIHGFLRKLFMKAVLKMVLDMERGNGIEGKQNIMEGMLKG